MYFSHPHRLPRRNTCHEHPIRLRKKCFPSAAFPQRLEAAVDFAAVTARVELVPFPKLA
jgi:hypothetical protein